MSAPDDQTIAEATREFTAALSHDTLGDIGPSLTCSEADYFAQFLNTVGAESLANTLLKAHAEEDDEGDDHYQDEGD